MAAVEVEVAAGEVGLSAKEAFYEDVAATRTVIEVNLFYIRYISDISTVDQTFRVAVGIDMEWKATEKDQEEWAKGPEAQREYVPEVVPNFELPNAKEVSIERRALENGNPFKLTESTGKNFLRAFIEATCLQQFNLRSFPFDVQDLVVNIDMSFALKDKLVFAPTENEDASLVILNRQYSAIPEFDFSRTIVKFDTDNSWSRMELHVQMARQPEGPLYRVAFPCFLLTMVTITSFGFDLDEEFAERIAYLVTLVLTFVAFAFTISQQLPLVPYLTLLDKYNMSSFTMVVVLLGCLSLIKNIGLSVQERAEVDTILFYVFGSFLVLINIYFGVRGYLVRRIEMQKLNYTTQQLKDAYYNEKKDSAVTVTPMDLLPDANKPQPGERYVSFAART